ncbi:MAG: hypothetical protein Roseis2KO_23380 [Roseivirga sp.]
MKNTLILFSFAILVLSCGGEKVDQLYLGGISASQSGLEVDTVTIDASIISGQGQFYLEDGKILYADHLYASIYNFDLNGKFLDRSIGLGPGPAELPRLLSLFPVNNDRYLAFVDTNIGFFVKQDMEQKERFDIDFGWRDPVKVKENRRRSNRDGVFIYEPFQPNELIANVELIGDKHMIFQVDASRIDFGPYSDQQNADEFYKEAHIFGQVNLETGEFEKVFGNYSPRYQEHDFLPNFRSFSFDMKSDTIFVSYPIDSLIYAYKYPDQLLYTFGSQGKGLRTNYRPTTSQEQADNQLDTDLMGYGNYFHLKYVEETDTFFRTYIKGKGHDLHGLQVYEGTKLIADLEVSPFFQVLGHHEGYYYATNFLIDEENQNFKIYKFKLESNG